MRAYRYNLRNKESVILAPGAVVNAKEKTTIALMFTEYFQINNWNSKTDQVLTAFGSRNIDSSTFLTSYKGDFGYN